MATAFVIESYNLLQPDPDEYTAAALYALVVASNSSAAASLVSAPATGRLSPVLSLWINGLWFTSLFLSLAVALLCILVKQWLGEYVARTTATAKNARDWCHRRVFYSHGVTAWHVETFISVLPLLLHLALFLFFAGVASLLLPLSPFLGIWISTLGASLCIFYVLSTAVPFWWPDCPSATPLIAQLGRAWLAVLRLLISGLRAIKQLTRIIIGIIERGGRSADTVIAFDDDPQDRSDGRLLSRMLHKLQELCRNHASAQSQLQPWSSRKDEMDEDALRWLILGISDGDANSVGVQALGAAHASLVERMRTSDILSLDALDVQKIYAAPPLHPSELARVMRSQLLLGRDLQAWQRHLVDSSMFCALRETEYPDMCILSLQILFSDAILKQSRYWTAKTSPSLHSTALIIIHCRSFTMQSDVMRLLLCVALDRLSDHDWQHIFMLLSLRSWPLSIHCHQSRTDGHVCCLGCLPEVLAEMLHRQTEFAIDVEHVDMAMEIMARATALHPWPLSTRLIGLPQLCTFFLSQHFSSGHYWIDAVTSIAQLLERPETWLPVRNSPCFAIVCRALTRITTVILPAMKPTFDRDRVAKRAAEVFTWSLLHDAGSIAATSSHSYLTFLLGLLLQPIECPGDTTAWSVFGTADLYWRYITASFPEALATALGVLCRHEPFPRDMVDSFFAWKGFGRLLMMLFSEPYLDSAAEVDSFLHMAQHCVELRPSWWFELLNSIPYEHDETLRFGEKPFCIDLDARLSVLGPCRKCPGTPLGYEDLEDGPPIACSFDPS